MVCEIISGGVNSIPTTKALVKTKLACLTTALLASEINKLDITMVPPTKAPNDKLLPTKAVAVCK